jgi:hypothetical protein
MEQISLSFVFWLTFGSGIGAIVGVILLEAILDR